MKAFELYSDYLKRTHRPPSNLYPFDYSGDAMFKKLDKAPVLARWLHNLAGSIAEKVSRCRPKIARASSRPGFDLNKAELECKSILSFRDFLVAQEELLIRKYLGSKISNSYVTFDIGPEFEIIGIYRQNQQPEIYPESGNVHSITTRRK